MGFLGTLLLFLSMAGALAAIISLIWPIKRIGLGTRKRAAAALGGSIVVFAIGGTMIEMSPMPPARVSQPPPLARVAKRPSILKADEALKSVNVTDPNINLKVALPTAWNAEAYVASVGALVRVVAKSMQAGVAEDSPSIRWVTLEIEAPGTDRLGRDTTLDMMSMTLPAEDLRAAVLSNLSNARILDLANDVAPGGREGAAAIELWCARNISEAPNFCSKAVN